MDFSPTSQYYVVGNDEGKALLYRYVNLGWTIGTSICCPLYETPILNSTRSISMEVLVWT